MSKQNAPLNDRQKAFVDHFLVLLNATEAAKKAGYAEKSARSTSSDLLTKPNIQKRIDERRAEIELEAKAEAHKVIEELATLAFSDFTDFCTVDDKGEVRMKNINELPRAMRKSIKRLDIKTIRKSTGKTSDEGVEMWEEKITTTIHLHDKLKSLELLGMHLGVFNAKRPDEKPKTVDAEAILAAARRAIEGGEEG